MAWILHHIESQCNSRKRARFFVSLDLFKEGWQHRTAAASQQYDALIRHERLHTQSNGDGC
jgi:hypothetical protein